MRTRCGIAASRPLPTKAARDAEDADPCRPNICAASRPKADFLIAGGTDMLRSDPEYDLGITGAMKIAHLAEAFGVDVEIHACGPAHRHCMAATPQHQFLRARVGRPRLPQRGAAGLYLRLQRPARRRRQGWLLPGPDRAGPGVAYDWTISAPMKRRGKCSSCSSQRSFAHAARALARLSMLNFTIALIMILL